MRTPGRKQYSILLSLGSGNAGLSRTRRDIDPLLAQGWVSARWDGQYYQMVRLEPAGFRALALAVEGYGLPPLREHLP